MITVPIVWLDFINYPSAGFVFDFAFKYNKTGTPTYYSFLSLGDDFTGVGLYFTETGIRLFSAVEEDMLFSDYLTISSGVIHKARIFVDPITNTIKLYVDGTLLATLTMPSVSSAISSIIYLSAHRSGGSTGSDFGILLYNVSLLVG